MLQNPRIEENPQRQPGTCISCGAASSSPRKWFLDTDVDDPEIPNYAIIFCDICFHLLAECANYMQIDDGVRFLKNRILELEGEVNELVGLRTRLAEFGISPDDLDRFAALLEVSASEPERDNDDVSGRTRSMESRETRLSESSDDERVGTIHANEPALFGDIGI